MKNEKQSTGKMNKSMPMNGNSSNAPEGLHEFFVDGLKDIYWAEKALTKAIPKMIKNATSQDLIQALTNHLEETEGQVTRLEDVFESIDEKAEAKKCDAMEGLIKEAEGIMSETDKGTMRDAGIIAAGQKVEHYEIASYGTLAAYAGILGLEAAKGLLAASLSEEKAADEKLTEITPSALMVSELMA
jgi:ferritin-like metal-binding protein YciE